MTQSKREAARAELRKTVRDAKPAEQTQAQREARRAGPAPAGSVRLAKRSEKRQANKQA